MDNNNLLKQIEKLIKPLEEGQKRLEQGLEIQGKQLESQGKELKAQGKQLNYQGKDIKGLKQDMSNLDLKIEIVNNNLKKTEKEIISQIKDILEAAATQKKVDEIEHRVKILEEKTDIHN